MPTVERALQTYVSAGGRRVVGGAFFTMLVDTVYGVRLWKRAGLGEGGGFKTIVKVLFTGSHKA